MKSNLIICTVGISLLQEKVDIKREKFPSIDISDISKQLATRSLNQATIGEKLSEEEHHFNKLFEELKNLKPNIELAKRGENYNPINPDLLPAELSSLYLFYWSDGNIPDGGHEADNKDIIVLLPSETNPSIFCAYCLKKYLKEKEPLKNKISEVKIIEIKGLQTKDTKRFEETALLNLSEVLREEIKFGHKNDYNVILNITGGYKAIPPYVAIIGNCFPEVDIIYLYEDSKDLIHLPPIPISFDLPTYRDYRAIINVLAQPGFTAGEPLYKILPVNIKACFLKRGAEKKLNFFGKTVIEKYKNEKISLTPYGRGFLLLDQIRNDKVKKYLTGCVNQWQHIWIGDKIPEMVEHQRGHTQRVLELAAEMLYPILEDKNRKIFQNDEELASFIGAIWLHDLGHSGESFILDSKEYVVRGFPSLIRDFHNLITYTILDEEKDIFPEKVEIAKDKWVEKNNVKNIKEIIGNIKTISKYHREWTPLTQDKVDEKGKYCIKLKKAIEDNKLRFLTALYRVLDACDTQLERTVDDAYIKTRKMNVNWEIKISVKEKEGLENKFQSEINNFITNFDKSECKECSDIDLKSLKGDLHWIFNEDKNSEEKIDKYADCIKCIVGRIITCQVDTPELIKRWLSCLDQIFFKKRQPFHYEKHKGIAAVMILPDGKEGIICKFSILMVGAENTPEQELRKVLDGDIICEYIEIKEVLGPFIKFKFSYQCYNQEPQIYKNYNDFA